MTNKRRKQQEQEQKLKQEQEQKLKQEQEQKLKQEQQSQKPKKGEVAIIKIDEPNIIVKLSDISGYYTKAPSWGYKQMYDIFILTNTDTDYMSVPHQVTKENYMAIKQELEVKQVLYYRRDNHNGRVEKLKYIKETSEYWIPLDGGRITKPKAISTTPDGLFEEIFKHGLYKSNSIERINKITKVVDSETLTKIIEKCTDELSGLTRDLLTYDEIIPNNLQVSYVVEMLRQHSLVDLITKLKVINTELIKKGTICHKAK